MTKKMLCFAGIMSLALLFGGVGQLEAGPITFNFNAPALPLGSDSAAISAYMTGIYGSSVTVTGAASSTNISPGPDWTGNNTQYIRTATGAAGDFEISFDTVPIVSINVGSLGFVFNETDLADFVIRAYDSTFGNRENPNDPSALVDSFARNPGAGEQINIMTLTGSDIIFSRPVTLLVFSDENVFDVGIDDLKVTPIPEPSTLILLGIGFLSLVGYSCHRRKHTT